MLFKTSVNIGHIYVRIENCKQYAQRGLPMVIWSVCFSGFSTWPASSYKTLHFLHRLAFQRIDATEKNKLSRGRLCCWKNVLYVCKFKMRIAFFTKPSTTFSWQHQHLWWNNKYVVLVWTVLYSKTTSWLAHIIFSFLFS